jgi:hypothetical protein
MSNLYPVLCKYSDGRFRQILETLARLEHTDDLEFSDMLEELDSQ